MFFDKVVKFSGNSQGIPNQRRSSQLVVKGVRAINNRPELDNGGSQDISAYLSSDMKENFQIPGTKAFLNHEQFGQFNKPNPQNIMRNILLENLINVVFDSFRVEILVDGLFGRGLVLELTHEDRLENDNGLSPHLPPRVENEFLQNRQLLAHHIVVDDNHVCEQFGNDLGAVDSCGRGCVVDCQKSVVKKLAPQIVLNVVALFCYLINHQRHVR